MPILYEDARISCDTDGLTVRWYYFPAGDKRIAYSAIRGAREIDMGEGILGGRYRIWGSGDFKHWFNFDPKRPGKRKGLVLDVGGWVRPAITPDDVDAVVRVLRANGVAVTGGA